MILRVLGILVTTSVVCGQERPAWFDECEGFGCAVTDTYDKESCVVSELTHDALSACVQQPNTHTTFAVSGTIELTRQLDCASDIIVDGSGQEITLTGPALRPFSNTIVYRITFDSGIDDGIALRSADSNAWVHHCSFRNYDDGMLDITQGFKDVTVSWCRFQDHNKGMLISDSPLDTDTDRITLHHNYWYLVTQRQPRVRYSHVHVYNSVYDEWLDYAICSSQFGRVLSENNYFSSNTKPHKNYIFITGDDPNEGYLRSSGCIFGEGSLDIDNEPDLVPDVEYEYDLEEANDDMVNDVRNNAGNV